MAFRRRMGTGLRAMLAIVIPAAAGELVLARPLVALVAGHGAAHDTTRHRRVARHAGARPARVLRLPLRHPRAAERPGPALGLLALRLRERRQHRAGRGPGRALRRAGHRPVDQHRLHRRRASWPWPTCGPGSRVWAGDVLGRPLGPRRCWPRARSWWERCWAATSRGPRPRSSCWAGWRWARWPERAAYVLAGGVLAELADAGAGPPRGARRPARGPTIAPGPTGRGPAARSAGRPAPPGPARRAPPGARRARASGAPPRPAPLPPAGRPPLRPGRLGPDAGTRAGRVAPRRRRPVADSLARARHSRQSRRQPRPRERGGPMASIQVVTDSACDLSPTTTEEHDVRVVPLTIRFGSEELVDRDELSGKEFWDRVDHRARHARDGRAVARRVPTGVPRGRRGREQRGGVRHASPRACRPPTSRRARRPRPWPTASPVRVVDTLSVTMGQGLLALAAADMASSGAGARRHRGRTART